MLWQAFFCGRHCSVGFGRRMGANPTRQGRSGAASRAPQATPAPTPAPPAAAAKIPCANPDALGISRVVEIDTTGGPGFGFEHFKQLDFLRDHEVVLTFDDGPGRLTRPRC